MSIIRFTKPLTRLAQVTSEGRRVVAGPPSGVAVPTGALVPSALEVATGLVVPLAPPMEWAIRGLETFGFGFSRDEMVASLAERLAHESRTAGFDWDDRSKAQMVGRLGRVDDDSLEFLDHLPFTVGPLDFLYFWDRLGLLPGDLALRARKGITALGREPAQPGTVAVAAYSLAEAYYRATGRAVDEAPLRAVLSRHPQAVVRMFCGIPLWPVGMIRVASRFGLIEAPGVE